MENNAAFVDLFTGNTNDGRQFWAIICVPPDKVEAYLQVSRTGQNLNLTHYGQIISSGWGASVPKEVVPVLTRHGIYLDLGERVKEQLAKFPPVSRELQ